jgi:hypothetical protein
VLLLYKKILKALEAKVVVAVGAGLGVGVGISIGAWWLNVKPARVAVLVERRSAVIVNIF